jgi:hypothetical protein
MPKRDISTLGTKGHFYLVATGVGFWASKMPGRVQLACASVMSARYSGCRPAAAMLIGSKGSGASVGDRVLKNLA